MKKSPIHFFNPRSLLAVLLFFTIPGYAVTINIIANTNWSAISSGSGPGGQPNLNDVINIKNGATLTIDVSNAACSYMQIGFGGSNSGNGTLVFNAGSSLSLIGTSGTGLFIGTSTYTGVINMTAGGTLSTPKIWGSSTGSLIPGSGTIRLEGPASGLSNNTLIPYITTYNNLVINESGYIVTLGVGITCNGSLTVSAGTLTTSTSNFGVTVNGTKTIASGATFNANNSSVNYKGNFSNSGTFTAGGSTATFNGTSMQTINGSSTTTFNILAINNPTSGAAITLDAFVNVNNNLLFTAGKISAGNYNLTMGNSGTITGMASTRYVIVTGSGRLIQQVVAGGSKSFPVGTLNDYIPATVNLTGGSTTDNFGLRVFDVVYRGGESGFIVYDDAVNASWIVSEAVAGGSNFTLTVQWPGGLELPGFNRDFSRLARYTGTGSIWDYGSTDIVASGTDPYSVSRSVFTNMTVYAVSAFRALPVTWTSVNGFNENNNNHIYWTTASETNNSYFEIEHASDGSTFKTVGQKPSGTNLNTGKKYDFVHSTFTDPSFYRIKQVDADGRYSFSPTIRITAAKKTIGLSIIPNPVIDKSVVYIYSDKKDTGSISIINSAGRLIKKETIELKIGYSTVPINLAGLNPGIYYLHFTNTAGQLQVVQLSKK